MSTKTRREFIGVNHSFLLTAALAVQCAAIGSTADRQPVKPHEAATFDGFAVARNSERLLVTVPATAPARPLALHLHSDRNARVSRFSDVSPLRPQAGMEARDRSRESWYPVIDFEVDSEMEAVIETSDPSVGAQMSWNGWVWRERLPLQSVLRIPAERLLQWENTLWVDRPEPQLTRFYVRRPVPVSRGKQARRTIELRLLDLDWSGRIDLVGIDDTGREAVLSTRRVDPPARSIRARRPAGNGLDAARLRDALVDAIDHTLRSRVNDPRDPMRGGLYVFYDLDARTYRSSHWVWGWGPSAGLLLEARKRSEIAARLGADRLLAAAQAIGEASLRTVATGATHLARGIPISRWVRSPRLDFGHDLAITPCDAGFLAGWTWVRLEEATGDRKWRTASERLVTGLDRLMTEFPVPPQNYWPDHDRWDARVIDEAGFGVELFAELHRLTGETRLRDLGRRYIEQHLTALGRPDGLWDRVHSFDGRPNTPTQRMTRGLGWPMEGLLAAHRLLPEDGRYLDLARRMAEHLLAAQKPAGYWVHRFDQPVEAFGVGMKGTALWCWLFYELHRHTGDTRHLAAARRALAWLLDEQYFEDDAQAAGGHVTVSPSSGVGYRPWFRMTSTYGAAFFGLAILQELRL